MENNNLSNFEESGNLAESITISQTKTDDIKIEDDSNKNEIERLMKKSLVLETPTETVESVIEDAKNIVLNESESTFESKKPDYAEELERILKHKEFANKLIKENLEKASEEYNTIIKEIDSLLSGCNEQDKQTNEIKEIFNQKKLIYSNLALCYHKRHMFKESTQIDQLIISLDPKFDKSYARLIDSYMQMGILESANLYADMLKRNFNQDTINKYQDYLTKLKTLNEQADEGLRKLSKRSLKNMEAKEKQTDEKNGKELQKPSKNRFLKVLFGGILFFGSTTALFLLYRFKNRFSR